MLSYFLDKLGHSCAGLYGGLARHSASRQHGAIPSTSRQLYYYRTPIWEVNEQRHSQLTKRLEIPWYSCMVELKPPDCRH